MVDRIPSQSIFSEKGRLSGEQKEVEAFAHRLTRQFFQEGLFLTLGYDPRSVGKHFPTISQQALEKKEARLASVYPVFAKDQQKGLEELSTRIYEQALSRSGSSLRELMEKVDFGLLLAPMVTKMSQPGWLRQQPEDRAAQVYFDLKVTVTTRTGKEKKSRTMTFDEFWVREDQDRGVTGAMADLLGGEKPLELPDALKERYVLAGLAAQHLCQDYRLDGQTLLPIRRNEGYVVWLPPGKVTEVKYHTPFTRYFCRRENPYNPDGQRDETVLFAEPFPTPRGNIMTGNLFSEGSLRAA